MKRVFGVMLVVLLLAVSFLAACDCGPGYSPGTPAEFIPSGVTVLPSAPVVGDTVTISATVRNVGDQSGDCDVSLTVDGYTDSKSVGYLAGHASSSVSFIYTATTTGSYTVTLFVTDDDDAEGNATSTKTILHHNVAILDLSPSKTVVGEGFSFSVNVTVANTGDYLETLNITLYANLTVIATENITLIAGNASNILLMWNTSSFLKGNYSLLTQIAQVLGEKNLDDNTLAGGWTFITIHGDVDADRDVDIFDIVAIIRAYQSSEGDPKYVSNYDINSDGKVDIFDIVIATNNYKESW